MYIMMHMYLYNIIYTKLENNRNIWNGMNINIDLERHRYHV